MASLIWRVKNLVVEDGEVEGETKTNGVSGSEVSGGDLGGSLVSLQRLVGRGLTLVTKRELREVAVIITLPRIMRQHIGSILCVQWRTNILW